MARPQALDYLYRLQSHGIQPGLKTITELLERLTIRRPPFGPSTLQGPTVKGPPQR
jgi:hypothetical protein